MKSNLKEDASLHSGEVATKVTEGPDAEGIGGHASCQNHKTIRIIINLFISSILANIILSIFLLFYSYVGVQIRDNNNSTDYHWIPYGFRSKMDEGFSWLELDSNGYNNKKTFKNGNIDILLLGSSHAEGFHVKQNQTIISLMNYYCKPLNCYSIAVSGHELYNCINNLRYAYKNYKPNKYIIIEIWKIFFDSLQLSNVINNKHKPIPIHTNNKYVYYLQKYIPSSRSLVKQTSLWLKQSYKIINPHNDTLSNFKQNITIDNKNEYSLILNKFLLFARKSVSNDIPIMIIYHPSYKLQENGSIKNNTDIWYLKAFADACKNNNIIFIDTDNDLQELYKTSHKLPYGFINSAVCLGHLNKYGHEVIAKRLAKEILKLEERKHGTK